MLQPTAMPTMPTHSNRYAASVKRRGLPAAAPQFSLAHLTMLHCSPPELAEVAARAGYDFVSLRPITLGLPGEPNYPLGTDRALLNRTRSALRANGIRLLDIELARILDGVDVKNYLPAMEAGAELGGRHVLTSIWCADRNFALDKFIELCDLALPLGLTVDLEFVTFAAVRTFAEARDVVSASGCSNAGICVDSLHFDRGGGTFDELLATPRKYFHFAQICDAPTAYQTDESSLKQVARDGRLYLGEGGIDNHRIIECMPRIPYSIELPNSKRLAELGPEQYARAALVSTKQYFLDRGRPVNVA